jgi:hypothetical protein
MVSPNDRRAFVWDEVNGMRLLSDYLTSSLGLDLTGWTLIDAYAMTPDGSVIVGEGRNPNGQTEGWIARIAPSSAWAYCTAGTTTNGCAATMSAIGVPSATASSGFRLQATGVEGQKNGLYFYGFAPTLVPWKPFVSTSWLCVASPHVRTTTFNSGGPANGCDGSFALDWSAWVAANPHAAGAPYGVGESFYAQAWFRDPPAPRGTNLSNAIGWTLQP